ncbi:MAG: ComF family protein [Burkholderiaceae bacterium]|nr:ComF family protein [Burkholderiaceae bacterium]
MFRQLILGALDRLPARCAICHAWPSRVLCDGCVARFAQPVPRCSTCALKVPDGVRQCGACLTHPPPLDACLAAVDYAWPWSDCVAQFKFGGQPGWAGALSTVLRSTPWVEPALEQADRVLPMPLSRERLAERGFNQALLLARKLDANKTEAALLLRTRDTPHQTALPREERQRNVRGAFAVEPLRVREITGRRIVLVDDVMTSGASLYAAASALRLAGAAHITALVLARTE